MSKKPVAKFHIGNVTASLWENDNFYGANIKRSYKDKEGNWQSTDNLGHGDILNAREALLRAEMWMFQNANKNNNQGAQ